MDGLVHALFLQAGFNDRTGEIERGIAVVALGSYGRGELCLGSDVDLLVLHRGDLSPEMKDTWGRVLRGLWDFKLDVGHGVMMPEECIRQAMSDFRHLTSLLDMRFLMGSREFFRGFASAFWSRIDEEKESLLGRFLIYQESRVEKYGNQGYFTEPNIKEGLGGLRDIHSMAWMARVYFKTTNLGGIKRLPPFSHFALDPLRHSEGFLLRVRNHLHLLADGRREDRLLIPFQKQISRNLGYEDDHSRTAPERFMRNLYLHLNRIRYGSEEFRTRALDIVDPRPVEPLPDHLPAEFQVMKGNVVLREGTLLSAKDPMILLKAFDLANQRGLFLGSNLIWEAGHLISRRGKELIGRPGAKDLFLSILLKPMHPKLLRLALENGLIPLFIPEFKKIRHLVQFDYYHVETVDLHSLKTMEVMREIGKGAYDHRWPVLRETFEELEHPDWLYLTGLLHDIGKGYKGDHTARGAEVIPRILRRLGLGGRVVEMLPALVRNHLLLASVSQRRDLNDEKTAVQAAQAVGSVANLRPLFLITIADSIATGPMAGSDWRIMLLIELYLKVRHILERGILASPDATKRVEENKASLVRHLGRRFPRKEILQFIEQVPTRYFISTRLDDMAEHFLLALTLGEKRLSWTLQKLRKAPVTRVLLCTYDRPGLFSKMAGVFAVHNMDVLSGNIFTLKNGLALDIYEVTNPLDPYREREMWDGIYRDVVDAIEERLPLDALINKKDKSGLLADPVSIASNNVRIDNYDSDFYTIVEVRGGCRPGLLYDLAKEIFSQGLDIRFARVNRDKERTVGVFYVRDENGQKLSEPPEMKRIEMGIFSVIR